MRERAVDVKAKFVKKAPTVFLLVVCIRTGNSHMVHTSRLCRFVSQATSSLFNVLLYGCLASLELDPPPPPHAANSTYPGQMSQMPLFLFLQSGLNTQQY